jgi:uncharacterized protein YjiS (DUF1127 family)
MLIVKNIRISDTHRQHIWVKKLDETAPTLHAMERNFAMTTLASATRIPRQRGSLASRIWATYELGRSRAQLRELPDYMLADIGVTRGEAQKESTRPFWDLPDWWRG